MAPPSQLNPRAAPFVPGTSSAPAVSTSSGLNVGAPSFVAATPVFPHHMYPPGVAVGVGLNTGIGGSTDMVGGGSGAVGGGIGTGTGTGTGQNGNMVNGDGVMVNGVNGIHDGDGGNGGSVTNMTGRGNLAPNDPFSSQFATVDTARSAQPQNLGRFSTFDDYLGAQRQGTFNQNVGFTAYYLAGQPHNPYAYAANMYANSAYGYGNIYDGYGGYQANHVFLPAEHFAAPPEIERGRTQFRSGGGSWRRHYRGKRGEKKSRGNDEDA